MFCAALFIIAIALITLFIFAKGLPLLAKVGIGDFLFNSDWRPTKGMFGIGAMVVGSLVVTDGLYVVGRAAGNYHRHFYG